MIMSTVVPEKLVESLAKEELVLLPLAEYQALLAELEALQEVRDQLQSELIQAVELAPLTAATVITKDLSVQSSGTIRTIWD